MEANHEVRVIDTAPAVDVRARPLGDDIGLVGLDGFLVTPEVGQTAGSLLMRSGKFKRVGKVRNQLVQEINRSLKEVWSSNLGEVQGLDAEVLGLLEGRTAAAQSFLELRVILGTPRCTAKPLRLGHGRVRGVLPNGSRLSCGALAKDSFLNLRAP